jgi:hypothetical protein
LREWLVLRSFSGGGRDLFINKFPDSDATARNGTIILPQKGPLTKEGLLNRLFLNPSFALFLGFFCSLDVRGGRGALLVFVNGTGGIQQFLLARVKRMALAADFRADFGDRGTGRKSIAAGANDFGIGIKFGVNLGLHNQYPNIYKYLPNIFFEGY